MWSGKATAEGFVTPAIVDYHRVRAAAGTALIIVEHSFVHPQGRHSSTQLGAHDDACVEGLSRLAAAIRAEGAVACLQISHAGARASSARDRPAGAGALPYRHQQEAQPGRAGPVDAPPDSTRSSRPSPRPPRGRARRGSTRSRSTRPTGSCCRSSSRRSRTTAPTSTAATTSGGAAFTWRCWRPCGDGRARTSRCWSGSACTMSAPAA